MPAPRVHRSLVLSTSLLAACFSTTAPIRTVRTPARSTSPSTSPAQTLVVMLPGMGDEPEDYDVHGFVDDLVQGDSPADVIAVDAHFGYYQKDELVVRLRHDVFGPAKARGYRSIWVVGISLGGLGAILAAREFGDQIDGVVLLSPFLGQRAITRRIDAAGGVRAWQPPAEPSSNRTVELWRWLKEYDRAPQTRPPTFLAYGTREKADGLALLTEVLPAERVLVVDGGHEWDTWSTAWARLLQMDTFGGANG